MGRQLQDLIKSGQEALSSTVSVSEGRCTDDDSAISIMTDEEPMDLDPGMDGLLSTIPTRQLMLLYDEFDDVKQHLDGWEAPETSRASGGFIPGNDYYETSMTLQRPEEY